jgi:hypothetical protein
MMDQQQYKPLQLADVGRGSDAGSVLEEAETELRTLAHMLMDDAVYEDAAKLTITIDLVRQADGILLSGKCKSAAPSRKRKGALAFVRPQDGELVTQDAEQMKMFVDQMVRRGRKAPAAEAPASKDGE